MEQDGTVGADEAEEAKRQKDENWAVFTEENAKGAGNTMNRFVPVALGFVATTRGAYRRSLLSAAESRALCADDLYDDMQCSHTLKRGQAVTCDTETVGSVLAALCIDRVAASLATLAALAIDAAKIAAGSVALAATLAPGRG